MVSTRDRDIVLFVTSVGSYPVCVFGIIANIINIIVFTKNGFAESVNVCLLSLAVFDLCSQLIILGTASLGILAAQHVNNLNFEPLAVSYLVACVLNGCLYNTAGFISSFVNVERCLCFLMPLRVKTILTPVRSALAVFIFFSATVCFVTPVYLSVKLGWHFNTALNRTTLGIVVRRADTDTMFDITYYSTTISHFLCFIALVASNAALAIALRRQARWRRTTSQRRWDNESKTRAKTKLCSSGNIRVGFMIQMVSLLLLMSYLPSMVLLLVAMIIPEIGQIYHEDNRTITAWSIATFTLCANSSINFILYLRMNSRYRNTFNKMFRNLGFAVCRSKVGHSSEIFSNSNRTPHNRDQPPQMKDNGLEDILPKLADTKTKITQSLGAPSAQPGVLPLNLDSGASSQSSVLPNDVDSRTSAISTVQLSKSDLWAHVQSPVLPTSSDSSRTHAQSPVLPTSLDSSRAYAQSLVLPTSSDSSRAYAQCRLLSRNKTNSNSSHTKHNHNKNEIIVTATEIVHESTC